MKKIIIPVSMLFVAGLSRAQTTMPSTAENYVYTKTYLSDPSLANPKVSETVQYFDGIGRAKQTVDVKASPLGRDVVNHFGYDDFGRQAQDYLPVPQGGTLNGAIVPTPLDNASNSYGSEKIYSERVLEKSPLDRIQQQIQVGTDWSTKPVKFDYDTNITGEVKKFVTTTTSVNGATFSVLSLASDSNSENGNYKASQLYKNTVTDEDGNKTIEFKNGKGQTVLKRKVLSATENADTYYVYNIYNQVSFVIPPLASVSTQIDDTILNNLCYQYRYDGRSRLVEKKLPGKDWEYMVYDKQDRLVMTQDANLRDQGKWLFTKYDQFSRPVYTGILDSSPGRIQQVNAVEGHGSNNETRSASSWSNSGVDVFYTTSGAYPTTNFKLLSVSYYDTYQNYSFNPSVTSIIGEVPLSDNPATDGRTTKGLAVMGFVKNIEDDNWTKNYTYYDKKGRVIGMHSINYLGGYTRKEFQLDFTGLPQSTTTFQRRKISESGVTVRERFVYDNQNRLTQHYHQVDTKPEVLLAENFYNELSQLKNKTVGNNLQSIDYDYNVRGWLTDINKNQMSVADLGGKLFSYKMKYNQKDGTTNPDNVLFSGKDVKAKYNGNISEVDWRTVETIGANPALQPKRYGYAYDALNRISAGYYQNPTNPYSKENTESLDYDINGNILKLYRTSVLEFGSNTATVIDNLDYTYSGNKAIKIKDNSGNRTGYEGTAGYPIDYDANGNIKSMIDKQISNINYNYLNLPDALTVGSSQIYTNVLTKYGADGVKLRKENIKTTIGVSGITTTNETTDYLDGFQYLNITGSDGGSTESFASSRAFEPQAFTLEQKRPVPTPKTPDLQFFPTEEGFYDYAKDQYIYQYKDNLGNVRVSFARDTEGVLEITDSNDYYPFGMNHLKSGNAFFGAGSYKNYKYNGKELQETGMYDYGARLYMSDIGRWGVADELSEKFSSHSNYAYVVNDPINGFDPDGRDVIFLADSKAVPLEGHGAVIVGNEKDGWFYYSMNGTGEGSSPYGDSKNADVGTPLGKGLSPKQAMLAASKINPDEQHHYDRFVTVKTTKEEDEKIKAKAAEAASAEKYKVVGQSCATVMLDALNEIIDIRSNHAWYVPNVINPAPNNILDYFNAEKFGGIKDLNRFYLSSENAIQVRKVGKLVVGPLIDQNGLERY